MGFRYWSMYEVLLIGLHLFYLNVIGFAYLLLTEQVYMSRIVEQTLIHNINSLNSDRYYTASLMLF